MVPQEALRMWKRGLGSATVVEEEVPVRRQPCQMERLKKAKHLGADLFEEVQASQKIMMLSQ